MLFFASVFVLCFFFFFFNDTATTEIYTLSLHDALPISVSGDARAGAALAACAREIHHQHHPRARPAGDRKSTRLNSSHVRISYAVFCLKKKKHPPSLSTLLKKQINKKTK